MSETSWLWPTDASVKKKEVMMPSDRYSVKFLAWLRAYACAYFTFHAILVAIATVEEFWMYLTNLTYLLVMVSYHVLLWAHVINGDFSKAQYAEPTST